MADCFRKEIKYVITEEIYLQIKKRMDAVMQPDQYGKNGSYMVRTQYYDSIFDSDLQDNLNGVWKKGKIRIRIYSPDAVASFLMLSTSRLLSRPRV